MIIRKSDKKAMVYSVGKERDRRKEEWRSRVTYSAVSGRFLMAIPQSAEKFASDGYLTVCGNLNSFRRRITGTESADGQLAFMLTKVTIGSVAGFPLKWTPHTCVANGSSPPSLYTRLNCDELLNYLGCLYAEVPLFLFPSTQSLISS